MNAPKKSSQWKDIGIAVGNTIDRVRTPIAFGTLLSILAATVVIAAIWGNIKSNYFWFAIIVFALAQLGLACLFVWIGRPKENTISIRKFAHIMRQPVTMFVDDSPMPIYLCELTSKKELIVRYCNKALLELLRITQQQVINKDIGILIHEFRKHISDSERPRFDERQKTRIESGTVGKIPDSFLSTVIDTKGKANPMGREYRVWIRTFSLYSEEKMTIGACSVWILIPTDAGDA